MNNTNDATPTFTGTGKAGATIELFDGATSLGTTACDGIWAKTVSTLTDGSHNITAVATLYLESPASGVLSMTIDTSVPDPVLNGQAEADITTPFEVTIATDTDNNGPDGLTLDDIIVTNGAASGLTAVSADSYTVTITPDIGGSVPYDTTVSIAADSFTDLYGNNNTASNTLTVAIESGPTVAITATSPTNASPIPVTATFSEDVTGFAVDDIEVTNGIVVTVTDVSATVYTFDVTPDAEGTVTVAIAGAAATATVGGKESIAASEDFTYDTTPPDVTVSSTEPSLSNSATFDVSVVFSESTSNFVVGDLTLLNATATLVGSGDTYTATITPSADGLVQVSVGASVATDAAGNDNTASTTISITHDSTAPDAPTVASVSDDNGISGSDGITDDNTVEISGTAEPSSTVTVYIDGEMLGTVDAGTGNWTYDNTASDLTDGSYSLTATATDAAGNVSGVSDPLGLAIDTIAPAEPGISYITDDNGWFDTDNITNDTTLVINGTSESDVVSVEVFIGGGSVGTTTTVDSSGDWEFDYTGTGLAENTYAVTAKATDTAGNTSTAPTATSITIDTTDPTVILTSPTNPDNVFTITATFNENVTELASGDITVTNAVVSNVTGFGKIWTFTVTPDTSGAVTVTVNAAAVQDIAGNGNAASNTLNLTGDVTAPTVLLTTPSATVITTYTVTATFAEAVTGFAGDDIVVTNGTIGAVTDVSATVYTFDVTPIIDGDVTVTVTAAAVQDAVGNDSTVSNVLSTTANVPPEVILTTSTGSLVTYGDFTVTATFNEDVTGLLASEITVINGTVSDLSGSGMVYTITIDPDKYGTVNVTIPADAATDGVNGNTASNTLPVVYSFIVEKDDDKWYEGGGCAIGNQSSHTLFYLIPILLGMLFFRRKKTCE